MEYLCVKSDNRIQRIIQTKYENDLKNIKHSLSKMYKDWYAICKTKQSQRTNLLYRNLITKIAKHCIINGVAVRKQTNDENIINQFVNSDEYKKCAAYTNSLVKYRDISTWQRYWIELDELDRNENIILILYKELFALTKAIYYQITTNIIYYGATNVFHIIDYQQLVDGFLGRDTTSIKYDIVNDELPLDMIVATEQRTMDGKLFECVIFKSKQLQWMAASMDAKGKISGIPSKKFMHGTLCAITAMRPGATQLRVPFFFSE